MTDDQHGESAPQGGGRWNPLPQGDYDDGATAFVKLPEGGIDALLSGDSPLAAPGHGYVPPPITVSGGSDDPAATGTWTVPADGHQWPDPNAVPQDQAADDRFAYHPGATQQWTFEEPAAPSAPGHDVTGQWSIPVAGGDLPDESGEFTTSSLVEQWGGTPPATLPGGAPAPWATEGAGQPWAQPEAAPRQGDPAGAGPSGHPHPADTSAAPGAPASEGFAPPTAYTGRPAEHGPRPAPEAGPAPAHPGHASGTDEPQAGSAAPAPSGGHSPAQAPEGPADGPAAHDGAAEPEHAPQAVGTAVTADAPDPAGPTGPVGTAATHDTAAHDTAPSADTPGPDVPPESSETHDTPDAPAAPEQPEQSEQPEQDTSEDPAPAALAPHDDHPLASYVLSVNGTDRPVTDAWIGESLLYVLRERLGLAGAKDGCSQGECGACNVQVDGRLVASCLVPAVTAAGSEVRTVEGLAADGQPSDVQRALARCGAVQCGFCVPGMAMTVHDLLEGNPAPTELETRQALCGNLCRCSGYRGVLEAVQEVVAERETHHTAPDAETDGEEARIPHQAGPGSGGVNPSAFESPGVFDSPGTFGTPGPHDQHYGQDGGQA
ncbi:aerobic-type carbon monoxide dehydrogenase small subunit (CoxS/CutS family) [Streptomyces griseochromogenes]|uniref:(2Fe-2S)-binding protein n=1 Tax=Streptomyces griseochromogenes TaxID=68214 RepID=A0A1B1B968_9ACTN|nr:2Fe-2S iron-sulfur cluster-binding protein [Streptomyces griseochromogenes]ANP55376.1 (2Fe-2S)-binding protein [Streptomyces griseochromogenes]MBP2054390.1 aerobic-type carbon monoxide dehydrogenase small subunit (CoxS/CutS family) [Streptomyces griseochromogenes]